VATVCVERFRLATVTLLCRMRDIFFCAAAGSVILCDDLLLDLCVLEECVVVLMVAAKPPRLEKIARQKTRAKGERFVMRNLKYRWAETNCDCRRTLAPPITAVLRFANGTFIVGSHRPEFNRKLPLNQRTRSARYNGCMASGRSGSPFQLFARRMPRYLSSSYLTHFGDEQVVPRMVPAEITPFWVDAASQ
jgi:hypothetical protein